MAGLISQKDRTKIEQILTGIDSSFLLQEDESVIEGCFPIRIKNRKYFCLLTDSRLILTAKKGVVVPQKLQIFPFLSIEEISLDVYRHSINLILNMISIIGYIAAFPAFRILSAEILYCICLMSLILLAPFTIYYFIRGEDIVRLRVPGKTLSLRRNLKFHTFYGRGTLTYFEIDENSSKIHGKKGDIKDLYSLLVSYIKSF